MSSSFMLPEWSPCDAVLLAWPYPTGDWADNFYEVDACYWDMLQQLATASPVWVLLHSTLDASAFERRINALGLSGDVSVRCDVEYNDTWIRDYGPISCADGFRSFQFNGWGGKYNAQSDNQVAHQLENWLTKKPLTVDFVCEGGGLEVNAHKTLLVNTDCIIDSKRNAGLQKNAVQDILKASLGVESFIWLSGICLTGDDTDGHIDTVARFAPSYSFGSAIVYSGRNPDHHDAQTLEQLHLQLSVIARENNWPLFELPTPIVRSDVDGRLLPATYANFLLCNQHVFVPVYGVMQDELALKVIAQAYEGFKVIAVSCAPLLEQHGSLHCATMQIASEASSG